MIHNATDQPCNTCGQQPLSFFFNHSGVWSAHAAMKSQSTLQGCEPVVVVFRLMLTSVWSMMHCEDDLPMSI